MTDPERPVILVIEDEAHIRRFLKISLEAHGMSVLEARLGSEGLTLAGEHRPQLVVLDLGLPDMDGQEIIRRLREWSRMPILVLSVRDDEKEKVRALDAGANDYVTKPAGISELMARVRVLLRSREPERTDRAVYERAGLCIDLARREVSLDGTAVHLTRKEYELPAPARTRRRQRADTPAIADGAVGPGFRARDAPPAGARERAPPKTRRRSRRPALHRDRAGSRVSPARFRVVAPHRRDGSRTVGARHARDRVTGQPRSEALLPHGSARYRSPALYFGRRVLLARLPFGNG